MKTVFADWLKLCGVALLVLVVFAAFASAQGSTGYEWKASDYSGATLYRDGKVVGVYLGKVYYTKGDKSWTQSDLPKGAPPMPQALDPVLPPAPPAPPAVPPIAAPGACSAATEAGAGIGGGQLFYRLTHPFNGRFRGRLRGAGCG